jgi:hypothetical protein
MQYYANLKTYSFVLNIQMALRLIRILEEFRLVGPQVFALSNFEGDQLVVAPSFL